MGRKVYISFKTEDAEYKTAIQEMEGLDFVDKSLNVPISSDDEGYILQKIRSDYLYDSTVTIFLIGQYSAEDRGGYEQRFIKRELQASLYNSALHSKNGILGIVSPHMTAQVFGGTYNCSTCGSTHNIVSINDRTVIREFSYNYFPNGRCSHTEEDRYCALARWDAFAASPETFIEQAFEKRTDPIAEKTKVRP
jgi:hypothetical protein